MQFIHSILIVIQFFIYQLFFLFYQVIIVLMIIKWYQNVEFNVI